MPLHDAAERAAAKAAPLGNGDVREVGKFLFVVAPGPFAFPIEHSPTSRLTHVLFSFLYRAMANVTYFVAMPFMILDDGSYAAGEAKELPSARAALSRANA